MKKHFKFVLIILIFLFIALYFSYRNGYYERVNEERKVLTDEMIKEYENDLKSGIDVTKKDYVIIKNDYTNIYTKSTLSLSNKIEKTFDKIIKYFFNKISNTINK